MHQKWSSLIPPILLVLFVIGSSMMGIRYFQSQSLPQSSSKVSQKNSQNSQHSQQAQAQQHTQQHSQSLSQHAQLQHEQQAAGTPSGTTPGALTERQIANSQSSPNQPEMSTGPEGAAAVDASAPAANLDICQSIERRGEGFKMAQIPREQWSKAVEEFHRSKDLLLKWLDQQKDNIPSKTEAIMRSQLKDVQLITSSSVVEPDLGWRGIGVWIRGEKDVPTIRLGNGFFKLVIEQPRRSMFEMLRMVAHTWSPCELKRLGAKPDIWNPLLHCLNVVDEKSCNVGSNSEAGWAVSSSLGFALSRPKCTPPVFATEEGTQCLQDILKTKVTE